MWGRLKAIALWAWRHLSTPAATLSLGCWAALSAASSSGARSIPHWSSPTPRSSASRATRWKRTSTRSSPARSTSRTAPASAHPARTVTCRTSGRTRSRARCRLQRRYGGKTFGTINTRRKFLDHRLELAQHEWARLKANDSLECRNCHSEVAMDLSKQTERAAEIHTRYLLSGEATCIDCHKGIAHELPNMEGVDPGWKVPPELQGEELPQASVFDELERLAGAAHGMSGLWWSQDGGDSMSAEAEAGPATAGPGATR